MSIELMVSGFLLLVAQQQAGPPAPRNRPPTQATEEPNADPATATVEPAAQATRPDFTGTWKLNTELSESFSQKIRAARAARQRDDGLGRGPGGRPGGPGGPGGRSPGAMGGAPASDGDGPRSGMLRDLTEPAKTLSVKHADPELTLGDDDARLVQLFTDGRKTKGENDQTEVVTRWVGDVVESERTGPGGRRVRITYAASPDRRQLLVTAHLTSRSGNPISVRTVYDLATKH